MPRIVAASSSGRKRKAGDGRTPGGMEGEGLPSRCRERRRSSQTASGASRPSPPPSWWVARGLARLPRVAPQRLAGLFGGRRRRLCRSRRTARRARRLMLSIRPAGVRVRERPPGRVRRAAHVPAVLGVSTSGYLRVVPAGAVRAILHGRGAAEPDRSYFRATLTISTVATLGETRKEMVLQDRHVAE